MRHLTSEEQEIYQEQLLSVARNDLAELFAKASLLVGLIELDLFDFMMVEECLWGVRRTVLGRIQLIIVVWFMYVVWMVEQECWIQTSTVVRHETMARLSAEERRIVEEQRSDVEWQRRIEEAHRRAALAEGPTVH